ncbi:hypothetical protein [Cyclobacterium xiamenense]|uniref:hypothetical protein n=1 Tax=Cyclobacterium xiamenense TaxID=1297121 RepID=UPI0012B9EF19|nr:hypothetical protein [Cyclobacterium xiamenense]
MGYFFSKEKPFTGLFLCILLGWLALAFPTGGIAQHCWSTQSYPDEQGFQDRTAGVLERLATLEIAKRSQGTAICPDTGRSFKTWAVEGEYVLSPYTGRKIIQGPTGYFGPRERGEDGQISRFGGDALKKDLIPATATLLLNPFDSLTRAFLSVPGNLAQQYHFAAKNWARFYPLLAEKMGPEWRKQFQQAVADYTALSRPSDGYRSYAPLSTPHDLVGEPGHLLGGNKKDGGTENHKIMWRSAALVYAGNFPDSARISGWPINQADSLASGYFSDFLKRLLTTGNGEYDSEIYYPHSIEALLNAYDFAGSAADRDVARAILDYYLITLAIKSYDGALAGAQKRGPSHMNRGGELSSLFHVWFDSPMLDDTPASLHQLSSGYRPNSLIWKLYNKAFDLPLELAVARPTYHMDQPNDAQEYFYASRNFGMGSIYLNRLDNPNQQVQWSLVFRTDKGPKTVGGGQPFHGSPGGHSPYTQTFQYRETLLVAAAETSRRGRSEEPAYDMRKKLGEKALQELDKPPAMGTPAFADWVKKARYQEACWLFIPKNSGEILEKDGRVFLRSDRVYLAITPFSNEHYWIDSLAGNSNSGNTDQFQDYAILVVPGPFSGYALEVHESDSFLNVEEFMQRMRAESDLKINVRSRIAKYRSSSGDSLEMVYRGDALHATGRINEKEVTFTDWSPAGVYTSDVLAIGEGVLRLKLGGKVQTMKWTKNGIERN